MFDKVIRIAEFGQYKREVYQYLEHENVIPTGVSPVEYLQKAILCYCNKCMTVINTKDLMDMELARDMLAVQFTGIKPTKEKLIREQRCPHCSCDKINVSLQSEV